MAWVGSPSDCCLQGPQKNFVFSISIDTRFFPLFSDFIICSSFFLIFFKKVFSGFLIPSTIQDKAACY